MLLADADAYAVDHAEGQLIELLAGLLTLSLPPVFVVVLLLQAAALCSSDEDCYSEVLTCNNTLVPPLLCECKGIRRSGKNIGWGRCRRKRSGGHTD